MQISVFKYVFTSAKKKLSHKTNNINTLITLLALSISTRKCEIYLEIMPPYIIKY